ncbi:hypothetical protein KDH_27950 [Dictyobacter sp. S3.2.2.5]|uniref:Uncharacterized protein n=1 Tax=Dictyobacter halimunensis TaxID=3026934 RepID=A0ABQ6FNW5_9CHLR|nr:hypothetical protein KDH_27950 [Dictyobacter sp. S3.2.2.5]
MRGQIKAILYSAVGIGMAQQLDGDDRVLAGTSFDEIVGMVARYHATILQVS